MLQKTQSCDKSIRSKISQKISSDNFHKTTKRSQSYLAQKFQQLYSEDKKLREKRKEKMQQNVKVKQQMQIVGCTFKPEINNNSGFYTTNQTFLQRQQNWKRNIDKKITEKRQQLSKKQVDGFTFQPKISDSPISSKKGKKSTKTGYSNRGQFIEKKSYKIIHNQRKKMQQIFKNTVVEPFKHRKVLSSTADSNELTNNPQNTSESKKQKEVKTETTINQQNKNQSRVKQTKQQPKDNQQQKVTPQIKLIEIQKTQPQEQNKNEQQKQEIHTQQQKQKTKNNKIQQAQHLQTEQDNKQGQLNQHQQINHKQNQNQLDLDKLNQFHANNDSREEEKHENSDQNQNKQQ